jgi:hypothetical protein
MWCINEVREGSMKAIVHGFQYDTDEASLIGEAGSDPSECDLYLWSAGLYRTPCAGRYFLAGYGGLFTRWRDSSCDDSGIIPLEPEGAREWAEQHLTTAEVEAGFADMIVEVRI